MKGIARAIVIQVGIFAVFMLILWLAAESWSDWCLLMAGLGGMCNFVALTQRERQIEKHRRSQEEQ